MEEFLIQKVKQYQVLYNVKSCNYRDQNTRHEAWDQIGRDLNIKPEVAKETWDKLRRCFLNAINRRRCKKIEQSDKKIPPWKYEYQMEFLLPFVKNRKRTISSLGEADTEYDVQEPICDVQDMPDQPERHDAADDVQQTHLQSIEKNTKRKRTDVKEHDPKETFKKSSCHEMDESDMFFMSMSRMTKGLPVVEQARIKLMLSNAVLQAQIRLHEGTQHTGTENLVEQADTKNLCDSYSDYRN